MKTPDLKLDLLEERRQDLEQETELADQAAEVVAGRGEDGVGSFAVTESRDSCGACIILTGTASSFDLTPCPSGGIVPRSLLNLFKRGTRDGRVVLPLLFWLWFVVENPKTPRRWRTSLHSER